MEKIEFKYFKLLAIYSVILGGACSILSLIPIFMPFFSLLFLPFFGCIAPFLVLILKDEIQIKYLKTYAVLGALSGICLCFGYFIIFVPLVRLIVLINKNYYSYGITFLNPFLAVMFFVMIASVYAITNSVVGIATGFVYNYFKGTENEKNG